MSTQSPLRAAGQFCLTSLLFGSSFVAIKFAVSYIPPLLLAAFRFLIGGVVLLGLLAVLRNRWQPTSRGDVFGIVATGVFIIGIHNATLNIGIQFLPSATAAILFALIPIMTTALATVALETDTPQLNEGAGVVIGLVGVIIVIQPDQHALGSGTVLGHSLVLLAVSAISVGSVLLQRVDTSLGILAITAWGMLVGGVATLVTGVTTGERLTTIQWTWSTVGALGYLSVIAAAIGHTLYFDLIDRIGSHRANLLAYLDPVVASLVGWLLLREAISETALLGFLVICLGFALVEYRMLEAELQRLATTLR